MASIGVLVLFLLKVAGGEKEECSVKIESIIPLSLSFTAREPIRTSSLWSMPRITLSPAASLTAMDLHRSSANNALGLGFESSLVSLKYLQCWFQTKPGLRGFLTGQYAAYTHKVVKLYGNRITKWIIGEDWPWRGWVNTGKELGLSGRSQVRLAEGAVSHRQSP